MSTNPIQSDENRSKRKKEMENEFSYYPQLSFFENTELSLSANIQSVHKIEDLEKILNDASKEVNILLSKYAHVLSERATVEASYVEELEGVLKEAKSIEKHLKLKMESLKHTVSAINGSLQNENGLSGK